MVFTNPRTTSPVPFLAALVGDGVSSQWCSSARGHKSVEAVHGACELPNPELELIPTTPLSSKMATPLFFSTFEVTRQAFHRTALAYAIVNLKPIVPGRMSPYPITRIHSLFGP